MKKRLCCFIPNQEKPDERCDDAAEYQIWSGYNPGPEDYTEVCKAHLEVMLDNSMRFEIVRIPSVNEEIIRELTKAVLNLGAKSELLAITGSYQDTLDDEEVLEMLQQWNDLGPVMEREDYKKLDEVRISELFTRMCAESLNPDQFDFFERQIIPMLENCRDIKIRRAREMPVKS